MLMGRGSLSPRPGLLDAVLVHADLARGGENGGPGVVGQRDAVPGALGARALLGLAGDQDLAAGGRRLGALEVGNVAGDVGGEPGVNTYEKYVDALVSRIAGALR